MDAHGAYKEGRRQPAGVGSFPCVEFWGLKSSCSWPLQTMFLQFTAWCISCAFVSLYRFLKGSQVWTFWGKQLQLT